MSEEKPNLDEVNFGKRAKEVKRNLMGACYFFCVFYDFILDVHEHYRTFLLLSG